MSNFLCGSPSISVHNVEMWSKRVVKERDVDLDAQCRRRRRRNAAVCAVVLMLSPVRTGSMITRITYQPDGNLGKHYAGQPNPSNSCHAKQSADCLKWASHGGLASRQSDEDGV